VLTLKKTHQIFSFSIINFYPHHLAVGIFVFLWIVFFWRLLTPVAEDRVVFPLGDFTVHYFPYSQYGAERLAAGEFPLWNPYSHAGSPFAADPQASVFYPPRWVSIWLNLGKTWQEVDLYYEVAAHYLLATLLMYMFLWLVTKNFVASTAGSVMFAYGGYLTAYPMLQITILYGVVWLPLVLSGIYISTAYSTWKIRGALLAASGIGLSILGGHPQTNVHVGYLSLAYLIFMTAQVKHSWAGFMWRVILIYGTGVLIGLVQLWPTLEFATLTTRAYQYHYSELANGFAIADSLQVFLPGFFGIWSPLYIGVVGNLLALGAIGRRIPASWFWGGMACLTLLLSFGKNTAFYGIAYVFLPGLGMFRQQERFALGFSLAMSVLAAYQIDYLLEAQRDTVEWRSAFGRMRWLSFIYIGGVGILIGGLLVYRLTTELPIVDFPMNTLVLLIITSVLFLRWLNWQANSQSNRLWVTGGLLFIIMIDLFSFGEQSPNFLPDTPENRLPEPKALEEMQISKPENILWRVDGAGGLQNYGMYFHVPDIYGPSPLYLDSIDRLRQLPVDRFWEVLAVRYVTTTDVLPPGTNAEYVAEGVNLDGQTYHVYKLDNPRPMAHLVYRHILGHNPDFTQSIMADPAVDLREIVVTHGNLPLSLPNERPTSARVIETRFDSVESVSVRVQSSENAILTIAIPYYPGWSAEIDGQKVKPLNVYNGLIGIPIAGKPDVQHVWLYFAPRSVRWGGRISLITSFGVVGYLLRGILKPPPPTTAETAKPPFAPKLPHHHETGPTTRQY
jgi:hypothetical protein